MKALIIKIEDLERFLCDKIQEESNDIPFMESPALSIMLLKPLSLMILECLDDDNMKTEFIESNNVWADVLIDMFTTIIDYAVSIHYIYDLKIMGISGNLVVYLGEDK